MKDDNITKTSFLSGEDWEIIYEHGGQDIDKVRTLFMKIFDDRARADLEEPLGDTIGELLITLPEEERNKIYRLFGKAILNCKKKGYLEHIKLK
jgi:hypothetical protein